MTIPPLLRSLARAFSLSLIHRASDGERGLEVLLLLRKSIRSGQPKSWRDSVS